VGVVISDQSFIFYSYGFTLRPYRSDVGSLEEVARLPTSRIGK
jgi:hypothetical protein